MELPYRSMDTYGVWFCGRIVVKVVFLGYHVFMTYFEFREKLKALSEGLMRFSELSETEMHELNQGISQLTLEIDGIVLPKLCTVCGSLFVNKTEDADNQVDNRVCLSCQMERGD